MATTFWLGGAPAVAQVSTFTVVDTWATNDIATLTCGSASVTFTVGATQTVSAVVAGLVSLWNASIAGELAELTATDNDPAITLTSNTAGVPFTVTSSETTGGDGTVGNQVDTTANGGPNAYDVAANWSEGSVPGAADDVVFQNSAVDCLYGLSQAGDTKTSLTQHNTFTGQAGLPRNNANGYVEYRPQYLAMDVTLANLGLGAGSGSPRFNLDCGTVQTTVNIWNSGTAPVTGVPSTLWKGTNTANKVYVNKGNVGIAYYDGETAHLDTLDVGFVTSQLTDSTVVCGAGLDLANGTVSVNGGTTKINGATQQINILAGTLTVGLVATVTTELLVTGGTCYYASSGTCTLCTITSGGTVDMRRDPRARTFTAVVMNGGGSWYDPVGSVTYTNGIDVLHTNLAGVTIITPESLTWTPSAP